MARRTLWQRLADFLTPGKTSHGPDRPIDLDRIRANSARIERRLDAVERDTDKFRRETREIRRVDRMIETMGRRLSTDGNPGVS